MMDINVQYSSFQSLYNKTPIYYTSKLDGTLVLYSVSDEFFTICNCVESADVIDFTTNHQSTATIVYSADDARLLGYQVNTNALVAPKTKDGRIKTANGKGDETRTNFYSFNWCDKTTWYQAATYVSNEAATDSGDHTTYILAHQSVIDNYHGKITLEDTLKDSSNRSYRVVVKVNGTTKTERDPHLGSGGDYSINYAAGTVAFYLALDAADVVAVNYFYATTSLFKFAPTSGKLLSLSMAECQFSVDIDMTDSIILEVHGYVDVFAPQYLQSNGGPYPSLTKIPIMNFTYKSIQDLMNDSFRAYPVVKAIGGSGWRGIAQDMAVFDWDYVASTSMRASQGIEMRVKLAHDTPFGGTFATVTFYCTSSTE